MSISRYSLEPCVHRGEIAEIISIANAIAPSLASGELISRCVTIGPGDGTIEVFPPIFPVGIAERKVFISKLLTQQAAY